MQNRISLLLLLILTFSGCMNMASLEKKALVKPNQTEHVFRTSLGSLRTTILATFNENRYIKSSFYNTSIFYFMINSDKEDHKMFVSFTPETSHDALFGKEHFAKPGTEDDIYLHSFGMPWISPIYSAMGKPLEVRTPFILQLKEIDAENTLLKVYPEDPKVIKGVAGLSAHGFYSKDVSVEPTTIEEYSLILFIAEQLGDTTLEPLRIN